MCRGFFGGCFFFYHAKSVGPGSLSRSVAACVSRLYFPLLSFPPQSPSVSLASISTDFFSPLSPFPLVMFASHLLSSHSLLHLSPFDQKPVCSFSFPSILLLLLLSLCALCHSSHLPLSRFKTVFALDCSKAPGHLNRWRGYFSRQTLCASASLR